MDVLYFGKAVGASGGTLMFSDDPQSFPQSEAPQQKLEVTWYHPCHRDLDPNQVCPKREDEGAGKVDDMANWGKVATMKALPSLPQNWANSKLASLSTMFASNWSHSQLWFHSPSLPLAHAAPPIAVTSIQHCFLGNTNHLCTSLSLTITGRKCVGCAEVYYSLGRE